MGVLSLAEVGPFGTVGSDEVWLLCSFRVGLGYGGGRPLISWFVAGEVHTVAL